MKLLGIVFCAFFVLAFGNSVSRRSGLTKEDYELTISDHPSCSLDACIKTIERIPELYSNKEDSDNIRGIVNRFKGSIKSCREKFEKSSINGLVSDENVALCCYTDSTRLINTQLEKGTTGIMGCFFDYFFAGYDNLLNAKGILGSAPRYYSGVRFASALHYGFFDDSKNLLLNEGDTITASSILSVSSKAKPACWFIDGGTNDPHIYFLIEPLQDTLAVDITRLSIFPDEAESIFPPNAKFSITKIEKVEKNPYCNGSTPGYIINVKELKSSIDYKSSGRDPEYDKYEKIETTCANSFVKLSVSVAMIICTLLIATLI